MSRLFISFTAALAVAVMVTACGGSSPDVDVQLTTTPNPPRMGTNTFEATVTQGGTPVTDATVSVDVYMAAMPSMSMPEMRSSTTLTHQANGRYIGEGRLQTPGNWDTTVTVKRGTQTVATKKLTLAAQ
jgi:hypothetical protein